MRNWAAGAVLLLATLCPRASAADATFADADKCLVDISSAVSSARELGRRVRSEKRFYVRLPTVEVAALRNQPFLSLGPASGLTAEEKKQAAAIFGDAIDLDAVRVVYVPKWLGSSFMVWGDTIRVPIHKGLAKGILLHELTHVWQYQTKGTAYISDSLLHQAGSFVESGKTGGAYRYKDAISSATTLADLSAEQQAELVEDYSGSAAMQADPFYQGLIAELRKSKAVKGHAVLFEEQAAGLAPRDRAPLPLPGWEPPREGGSVPLLEIRFPGL